MRQLAGKRRLPVPCQLDVLISLSVDSATSTLMQEALRKAFDKKTVIAIAHRLETIIDFDRVIILEEGAIIESGNPKNLLTKPGSEFKRLSETMGEAANKQSSSTA